MVLIINRTFVKFSKKIQALLTVHDNGPIVVIQYKFAIKHWTWIFQRGGNVILVIMNG